MQEEYVKRQLEIMESKKNRQIISAEVQCETTKCQVIMQYLKRKLELQMQLDISDEEKTTLMQQYEKDLKMLLSEHKTRVGELTQYNA